MKTAFFVFFATVSMCLAQAVNISGVVKNKDGVGIDSVVVRLGKADITAMTGPDGSFTLKENATGTKQFPKLWSSDDNYRIIQNNDRLFFVGMEQAKVKLAVYDINGKLLLGRDKGSSSKNQSMTLPHFAGGIRIYQVSVNNERSVFKGIAGLNTHDGAAPSFDEISLAKRAKTTGLIDDALLFTKDGYTLTRVAITKPDTSGIQITLSLPVTGTVSDADGNTYQTVQIGNQVWTTENFRSTKNNDNTNLTQGSSYWFYSGMTDAAAKKKWGALYTFATVKAGKLAPKGWHIPTDAEWDTLQNYLITHGYNYDGTLSGNKIAKSLSAKTDWTESKESGAISNDLSRNNASGFSAFPSGYRYYDGTFNDKGTMCYWWSATAYDASYAYYRDLWCVNFDLDRSYRVQSLGCSVRLVRDK
jgi:uncharacterized protein (TIGR02145 family)